MHIIPIIQNLLGGALLFIDSVALVVDDGPALLLVHGVALSLYLGRVLSLTFFLINRVASRYRYRFH